VSNVSISTNNLTIGYEHKVVQRDLSFSLKMGEMVCMLGKNGCGKSTLLRTLAGLQPVVGGEFSFLIPDTRYPISDNTSNIALVLTERLSLDNTTVHDVVAMGRYPYTSFLGGLSAEDEQIIAKALKDVGLVDTRYPISETPFNAHSDGEKQRILIAKAIAQETPIILLDEPTAHLDLPNRIKVLQLLRRLAHEQGKTILISTHELDLAIQLSDRILLMSEHGVQLDTPAKLREQNAFTHAFGMDIFNPLQH
jgi:iron complex transport system ATP-binding protein